MCVRDSLPGAIWRSRMKNMPTVDNTNKFATCLQKWVEETSSKTQFLSDEMGVKYICACDIKE